MSQSSFTGVHQPLVCLSAPWAKLTENVLLAMAAPADAVLDYLDSKDWGLHTLQIPQQFKFDHLTITQQLDQGESCAPGSHLLQKEPPRYSKRYMDTLTWVHT